MRQATVRPRLAGQQLKDREPAAVEGMRGADPGTFALMVSMLIAAAMIASFFPARHASRIDPIKALRQD